MKIDNKKIKITVWDTAGQERFRATSKAYYRGTLGAFIVYDITNITSFQNVTKWLQELRSEVGDNVLITLVGNKIDMRHIRAVTVEEGLELAKKYNMNFIETSACDSINVKTAFEDIVKNIFEILKQKDDTKVEDEINSPNENKKSVKLTIRADSKEKLKQISCCNTN